MKNRINIIKDIMTVHYNENISVYEDSFLKKIIDRRLFELGYTDFDEYRNKLMKGQSEAEILLKSLNIHFTDFFRDPLIFATLEQSIIPQMLNNKPVDGSIRIWSTSCCTGEEVYSLAMLINEQLELKGKRLKVRIFATDIEQSVINVAIKGEYNYERVQNVKLKYLNKYFKKKYNTYQIIPQIKESIMFSKYDLLDSKSTNPADGIYGDFDIIMCSNMLFYYNDKNQYQIIQKLKKSISSNGVIITDDVKSQLHDEINGLRIIQPNIAIFGIE